MSGGNWSVLGLSGDPVRGEPSAVRSLANASQQEAKRWEKLAQSLRTLADEGASMELEGDFAPVARRLLRSHPDEASPLARGRATAGEALVAYASQLEQAKRDSQMALSRGTQAKRQRDMAERNLKQVHAQMRAMASTNYYGPAYYAAVQRFNMLKVQEAQYSSAWERAEAQRMAAQQQAVAAGERAMQQENATAQKVISATPTAATAKT
jgi:hypothetical protein